MLDKFKEGINIAIPNEDKKEIVGAVLSVAYADGTLEQRAFMNEVDVEEQVDLIAKLIEGSTFAITSCLACVPTGIKKLGQMAAVWEK